MSTTIIFDLSEVYLNGFLGVEHHLEPILRMKAVEIYPLLRGKELARLFHGEITEEEYWSKTVETNGWDLDVGLLKRIVRDNFKEIEGTREIIEGLKLRGYKLGLLSVHAREWIDHCNGKYDYHRLFHSRLYSFEVGVSKPDKRAYELMLQKLGSKPEECIFIDDSLANLVPAREMGMKTIHFRNPSQLRKDLAHFGIVVAH